MSKEILENHKCVFTDLIEDWTYWGLLISVQMLQGKWDFIHM